MSAVFDDNVELMLTEEGEEAVKRNQCHCLGGQHRYQAASILRAEYAREIESIRKKIGDTTESEELILLGSALESVNQWTFALYDTGMCI